MDSLYLFLGEIPLCHISRLTETARLLKNVRNVFTFTRRSATRVNMEVELSRKYVIIVFSK